MVRGRGYVGALVAVVLLSLGLSACVSPAPTPTPTPTGFADEEAAFAAAEETYRAYVDALNHVDLSDPATFEDVYAWTTGELNASDRKSFSAWHAEGYSLVGEAAIVSIDRVDADLTSSVVLHACYDVSGVDVLDPAGNSLVSPDRPPIQSLDVSLTHTANAPAQLLVAAINPASDGTSSC